MEKEALNNQEVISAKLNNGYTSVCSLDFTMYDLREIEWISFPPKWEVLHRQHLYRITF